MMSSQRLFAAVALFLGCLSLAQAQIDDIGCYVAGECVGGATVHVSKENNAEDCLAACKLALGCRYWTYYDDNRGCLGLATCPNDLNTTTCTNCESGTYLCDPYDCERTGLCNGRQLSFGKVNNESECVANCYANPLCTWSSYYNTQEACMQFADCVIIDESYEYVTTNEKRCYEREGTPKDFSKVLLTGGLIDDGLEFSNTSELVDISGSELNCPSLPKLPNAIRDHVSFSVNDFPFVCGGYGVAAGESTPGPLSTCYTYQDDAWSEPPFSLFEARFGAAALVLQTGVVAIVGGRTGNAVTDVTESVETLTIDGGHGFEHDLPIPLAYHCLSLVAQRFIAIVGGVNDQGETIDTAWIYDADNKNFTDVPPMTDARAGHICQTFKSPDGGRELLVAGGYSNTTDTLLDTVEILNLNTLEWRQGPKMPQPVALAASVLDQEEGSVYVIGGIGSTAIYEYVGQTNSWVTRTETLSDPRSSAPGILVDTGLAGCT